MEFEALYDVASREEPLWLIDLSNFCVGNEEFWRVWEHNKLQIRLVMDGAKVERITFINRGASTEDSLRFAYTMQNIGHLFPPTNGILTDIRSKNNYIIKYLYRASFDGLAAIERMAFGMEDVDDPEEYLNRVYEEMKEQAEPVEDGLK